MSGAGRFSHNRTSADQKEIDYLISDERDLPGFKSKQNFEKKSAGIGAENNLLCPDGKDYCEDPSGMNCSQSSSIITYFILKILQRENVAIFA